MTTYRDHAQVQRKIINLDSGDGRALPCMFADCERPGLQLHMVLQHKHPRGTRSCYDWSMIDPGTHTAFPFCSDRHKTMFQFDHGPQGKAMIESRGGQFGYLPTGYRGSML